MTQNSEDCKKLVYKLKKSPEMDSQFLVKLFDRINYFGTICRSYINVFVVFLIV